jgi:hypothetical protein
MVFISGFASLAIGLFLAFFFVAASSHNRLADTCAAVEASRAEKRALLKAYEETPPTNPTGQNIRDAYAESLRAWDSLWTSLDCKDATSRT